MAIGPNTDEEAGSIVSALLAGAVEVVVSGHWAISAFDAENPSLEGRAWLMNHPAAGAIDLACPEQNRTAAKSVLEAIGFSLREESKRGLRFEDIRSFAVNIWLFRRARDGGRVYPKGGIAGEDWYYPPECVTNGRLGHVRVRTEGPAGLDRTRAAQASDVE